MNKHWPLRIALLLTFLSAGIAWAQDTTGSISGTARDTSGAVLPGVQVVALNEDTGISRTVETDASGHYAIPSLNLGRYRVTASHEGFETEVRSGIVLTVGREAVVDLSLSVGAVTQTVEVQGEAPLVEATTATLGSLVDDHTIRDLPLNGRSYDQLALLQPGVTAASTGTLSNTSLMFGSGKRFSVGGQRDVSNLFLLDGTDISDQGNGTPGGASGLNLGVDTILEFKIFTNSFKAEYGHSTGSITSAITRSGTNTLHGTLFEYLRNSVLDSRNFFDTTPSTPPFRRNQFGGVLGGPIKKDKTFYFAGYEGLRQGQETTAIATVPNALARQGILPTGTVTVNPSIVPYLNLYPLPNGRDFGDGSAQFLSAPSTVTNEDYFMARVDHQLNAKTGIFARYTFDNSGVNAPQSLPGLFQVTASRRQDTTLQANTILSPGTLNNFRFAFDRSYSTYDQRWIPDPGSSLALIPGQLLGAMLIGATATGASRTITQLTSGGGSGAFLWSYNIFQYSDDFTHIIGKHALKAGVNIERLRDNTVSPTYVRGYYSFLTLATFLQGIPSSFSALGPLGVPTYDGFRQTLLAFYGQDDYTVNSRLTLNLGLRWEAPTDPAEVNGKTAILPSPSASNTVISPSLFHITKLNFEPRLGLAWQLNSSGTTVLRAGAGIYHNQILPWAYGNDFKVPPFAAQFIASNPPFPNAYTLFQGLVPGPSPLVAVQMATPVQKTPSDVQYNLSLQQQISRNIVLQVAYAGNKADHLLMEREANTKTPTFTNGDLAHPFYPASASRLNPAWGSIKQDSMSANSNYNAVTVTLRSQLSSGFQGQIYYTYAKALDDATSTQSADSTRSPNAIMNPFDQALDWGLSDYNSKHTVVGNFSYQLPFRSSSRALGAVVSGWTLDGIATFTAGQPFTPRLATSVSKDLAGTFAERPNLNTGFSNNPNSGISAGCSGFPAGTPVGGPSNWYDPCAFSLPAPGTYGDLGRNTIVGPGLAEVDLALEKNHKLWEKANATFRFEMFNIMNHPNFGLPSTTALQSSGAASPSAGVITYTTTSSRQIQFGLRIAF